MTKVATPECVLNGLSEEEFAKQTRQDDISFFMQSDRIWPPNLAPSNFYQALSEVLTRIPDDEFEDITDWVYFVVYSPHALAMSVPFERPYPPHSDNWTVKVYTIVIFHQVLEFPHSALMGVLVHELAHCFVKEREHLENENATDALAESWGFMDELKARDAAIEEMNLAKCKASDK